MYKKHDQSRCLKYSKPLDILQNQQQVTHINQDINTYKIKKNKGRIELT